MDESIGLLVAELKKLGQWDNTIVIFLSDNGGGGAVDNGPLRGGKGRMFEGGLRVPCIIRWPGVAEGGRRAETAVPRLLRFETPQDLTPPTVSRDNVGV